MELHQELTVSATFVDVRRLADTVRAFAKNVGMNDHKLFEFELAVVEAANNIVEHGTAGSISDFITLFMPDPQHCSGTVVVELHSNGDPISVAAPAPGDMAPYDAERGRGLMLIATCLDEFHYQRRGAMNVWQLVKHLDSNDNIGRL